MKKGILSIVFTLFFLLLVSGNAQAAEGGNIAAGILLNVTQETNVYEEMDINSKVISTLAAETPIFSKNASQGEWVQISYQDITGYVHISDVCIYGDEELDAEFEQIANLNELLVNELEYNENQQKQKTVWTVIIVVLVIAIFAVSIASAIKKNANNEEKNIKVKKRHRK